MPYVLGRSQAPPSARIQCRSARTYSRHLDSRDEGRCLSKHSHKRQDGQRTDWGAVPWLRLSEWELHSGTCPPRLRLWRPRGPAHRAALGGRYVSAMAVAPRSIVLWPRCGSDSVEAGLGRERQDACEPRWHRESLSSDEEIPRTTGSAF